MKMLNLIFRTYGTYMMLVAIVLLFAPEGSIFQRFVIGMATGLLLVEGSEWFRRRNRFRP